MKQFKIAYGAQWLLIFYHDISISGFMTKEEAQSSDSPGKYSILNVFNSLTKNQKHYEFLLEYPNLDYIRWIQTANPTTTTERTTNPDDLGVVIKHNTFRYFRGLALSTGGSYLDGDGYYVSDYYYSIGTTKWDKILIPGPNQTGVTEVSLWIRVFPQLTCQCKKFIKPWFSFISFYLSMVQT